MSEPTWPSDRAGPDAQGAPEPTADQPAQDQEPHAPPERAPEGQAPSQEQELPVSKAVVARYGVLRSLGLFRHDLEESLRVGTKVVVRSERGLELAEVVASISETPGLGSITREQLTEHLRCGGSEYPFYRNGRLLRLANAQDLIDQRHLASSAREEAQYCRKEIRELKLDMKLVTVEHLLGGERIIFYFSSENRVDFRELVRRLASQFRTRIEMRQVGARDEARLVGDFERCGRPCCCLSFLKDLKPVSMRMAKMQKATLDPSKISGRCGRLMCCLRYEDAGYEELRAKLPRRNSYVQTRAGVVGKVLDVQVLTQLVRLLLPDGSQAVLGNEEIAEQNVSPPPLGIALESPQPPVAARAQPAWRRPQEVPAVEEPAEATEALEPQEAVPAELTASESAAQGVKPTEAGESQVPQAGAEGAAQVRSGSKRRRRRHRRRPPRGPQDARPAPAQPPATVGQGQQPSQAPSGSRRKRRRRRRRKH